MRKIFLFFGPPGSGKGTQSDAIGDYFHLPVISTGELLRHEEKSGTVLGKKIAQLIDKGELVSDELIHKIIAERIKRSDAAKGFILDGYPRDAEQLQDLLKMLSEHDLILLVEIRVSDKEVINRLGGRRVCDCGATYHIIYNPPKVAGRCNLCGKELYIRPDDKPEIIKDRLAGYKKSAEPLMSYAKKHHDLISVDGERLISEITEDLIEKLSKYA